jgi:hypothetical protein
VKRNLFATYAIVALAIGAAVVVALATLCLWPRSELSTAPLLASARERSSAPAKSVVSTPHVATHSAPEPTPVRAAAANPTLYDAPPPEDDTLRELEALSVTDKQAALTLAEKGDEWYSAVGKKAEARRAMRITLLVDLNRMPEARRLTRDFIQRYPDSPYRRLVQGVTGVHPRPGGPR